MKQFRLGSNRNFLNDNTGESHDKTCDLENSSLLQSGGREGESVETHREIQRPVKRPVQLSQRESAATLPGQ